MTTRRHAVLRNVEAVVQRLVHGPPAQADAVARTETQDRHWLAASWIHNPWRADEAQTMAPPDATPDTTPPWLEPRGQLLRGPTVGQREAGLAALRYLESNPHLIADDKPWHDAWVDMATGRMVGVPRPEVGCEGWQPLWVGDILRVRRAAPFITHDMLYIGRGYIVHFDMATRHYSGLSALVLCPLGEVRMQGATLERDAWGTGALYKSPDQPLLPRRTVVERAIASLGMYAYSYMRFNCQHVLSRIAGCPRWTSPSVKLALGAADAALVAVLGLLAVILFVCARRNKR